MLSIVKNVWNWIKTNWGQLLVILGGPISLAAQFITKNFSIVRFVVSAAIGFIRGTWRLLTAILSAPVSIAVAIIKGLILGVVLVASVVVAAVRLAWNHLKTALVSPVTLGITLARTVLGSIVGFVSGVVSRVRSVWSALTRIFTGPINALRGMFASAIGAIVGFVSTLRGRVASAASGMFDGIRNAFRTAANAISGIWNRTVGSLNFKVPDFIPGIGGKGWSAPKIPMFAEGGIVNRATLGIFGEREPEKVIPLRRDDAERRAIAAKAFAMGGAGNTERKDKRRASDIHVYGDTNPNVTVQKVMQRLNAMRA